MLHRLPDPPGRDPCGCGGWIARLLMFAIRRAHAPDPRPAPAPTRAEPAKDQRPMAL